MAADPTHDASEPVMPVAPPPGAAREVKPGVPQQIPAADGFTLTATRFDATGPSRGWVVINSAMGVKQEFYQPFARFLSVKGFSVLTWDYRGMGRSMPAPRGRIALKQWAELDMEGVLRWALGQPGQNNVPPAKVAVMGHSLGTQLLGLCGSADQLSGVVGVGSQLGDWRYWPFPYNLGMLGLATIALPGVTTLLGKLPAGMMGEELPAGPVADWAKWIRSRGYLLSEGEWIAERYARLTCPITGISIADDRYAPKRSVDALYRVYRNCKVERVHWDPKDIGAKQIGHFGPFRRPFEKTLWPQLARPFETMLPPITASA